MTRRATSPTSTDLRSWGTIIYYHHRCHIFTCVARANRGSIVKVNERPVNRARHPFRYWILPSGRHFKNHIVRLRVYHNERLSAVYRR